MKKAIGVVISTLRKESNLKQNYLAYKLSVSIHAYANLERGRSDFNSEKISAIAKLYGLKAYQIIILAEEILEVGKADWLPGVIKGILRISSINIPNDELTMEDQFLINMDRSLNSQFRYKTKKEFISIQPQVEV